jgi:hypothetical protein
MRRLAARARGLQREEQCLIDIGVMDPIEYVEAGRSLDDPRLPGASLRRIDFKLAKHGNRADSKTDWDVIRCC